MEFVTLHLLTCKVTEFLRTQDTWEGVKAIHINTSGYKKVSL